MELGGCRFESCLADHFVVSKVTIKYIDQRLIKIWINDLPHLFIDSTELVGIQSWKPEEPSKMYCIEYVFKTTTMLTEYDTREMWETILKLLDDIRH